MTISDYVQVFSALGYGATVVFLSYRVGKLGRAVQEMSEAVPPRHATTLQRLINYAEKLEGYSWDNLFRRATYNPEVAKAAGLDAGDTKGMDIAQIIHEWHEMKTNLTKV